MIIPKKVRLVQRSANLEDWMWEYLEGIAVENTVGKSVLSKDDVLRAIVRDHKNKGGF